MEQEKVFFKNNKGQKIAGLLFTPERVLADVVICPGFTVTKEIFTEDAKHFAENGFRTLVIDYFGLGESDGNWEDYTLSKCIDSLKAAINFLDSNVFVFGSSFGGKITLHTTAEDKRIKAISLLSPVTYIDFWRKGIWEKILKEGPMPYPSNPKKTLTKEFAKDLLSYDLDKDVKKIKCPVFITHGNIDKEVLVEGTKKLHKALNTEKGIHIFKDVCHGPEMPEEAFDASVEMAISWFKKHLK